MAEPNPIDRPGPEEVERAPGGTHDRAPLEFPRRESRESLNIWRVTVYFVLLVAVLSLIVYFILRPR